MATGNVQQVHGIALNRDFGQNPVGSLGGRTVQQVQPQPPRGVGQALSDFGSAIASLGTRLLDAITPNSLRGESKVRAGLEATSSQVGELIGALSKSPGHIVDGAQAKQLMDTLRDTAEPVTSRGASYDTVFKERVDVHLKNMSTKQLLELKEGLSQAGNSALKADTVAKGHLAVMENSLKQELFQRLIAKAIEGMKPVLEKSIDEVPRGPKAVAYVFSGLHGIASNLLKQHGQDSGKDMQNALIKEAINQLVSEDNDRGVAQIDVFRAQKVFIQIPTRQLRELSDTPAMDDLPAGFEVEAMLGGAIGVRAEQYEKAFMDGASKLLSHEAPAVDDPDGPLHNPVGFFSEIVDTAKHLDALSTHYDVHSSALKGLSEPINDKVVQLHMYLEERLSPTAMSNLGELSNAKLHQLQQALQKIGIERGLPQVTDEIAKRKAAVTDEYNVAMRAACDAAERGDLTALLKSTDTALEKANIALNTHIDLGEKVEGADDVIEFREGLVTGALAGLSEAQLGRMFATLKSPEVRALRDTLAEAGASLMPGRNSTEGIDPEMGRRMFSAYSELQLLNMCVDTALKAKGLSLPELPDANVEYGRDKLTDKSHEALMKAYGVEVSESGNATVKVGTGTKIVQDIFEKNLREEETGNHTPKVLDDLDTGVDTQFWLDLPRMNFTIRTDDGNRELIDRENLPESTSPEFKGQMLAGVEQLRKIAGGNPEVLMKLTQVAQQGLVAGIQKAMMDEDNSPIRLEDGTSVSLQSGTTSFHAQSDGMGGVILRCDYSVTDPNTVVVPGDDMRLVNVDPDSSFAHFSVEISINSEGEMSVSKPLSFVYDLQLAKEDQ